MPEEWYLPGGFWSLVWGVFLGIVFIVWLTIDINLSAASYMILQTIACFKVIGNTKPDQKRNGLPSLVWKTSTGLHKALTSTPSNQHLWTELECQMGGPGPEAQHQSPHKRNACVISPLWSEPRLTVTTFCVFLLIIPPTAPIARV